MQNTNRLPLSILLAVVGGLVGLIPNFISIFFFDTLLGLLYALIPLGAYFGYVLGKAERNKYTLILICIISFALAIGVFLLYYGLILNALNLTFADLFADTEAKNGFLSDLGLSALFTVFGLYISWRVISNYEKKY